VAALKEAGIIRRMYDSAAEGRLTVSTLATSSSSSSSLSSPYNSHNDSDALVRACVAGAFSPQLARIALPDKKYVPR
jgi:hypothetical protein